MGVGNAARPAAGAEGGRHVDRHEGRVRRRRESARRRGDRGNLLQFGRSTHAGDGRCRPAHDFCRELGPSSDARARHVLCDTGRTRAGRGDLRSNPHAVSVERAVRRCARRRRARRQSRRGRFSVTVWWCGRSDRDHPRTVLPQQRYVPRRSHLVGPARRAAHHCPGARHRRHHRGRRAPDPGRSEHRVRVQLVVLRGGRIGSARPGRLSGIRHAAQTRRRVVHGHWVQSPREDRVVPKPHEPSHAGSRRTLCVRRRGSGDCHERLHPAVVQRRLQGHQRHIRLSQDDDAAGRPGPVQLRVRARPRGPPRRRTGVRVPPVPGDVLFRAAARTFCS